MALRGFRSGKFVPPRAQAGFTLVETVVALLVVTIAILTIAYGLLTSITTDNNSNLQQRTNLALTTFLENLPYVAPPEGCVPVTDPPPSTGDGGIPGPSHGADLIENTLSRPNPEEGGVPARIPNPEVERWVSRGVVFTVTNVEYAKWDVSDDEPEDWTAPCDAPGPISPDPARPLPYYPVIKVTVEACWSGRADASQCPDGSMTVRGEAIRRGGRTG